MKPELTIEEGLVDNVLKELEDELVEKVYSKDLVDVTCASTVFMHVNTLAEREKIKKDICKAFVTSNWTQRVYFVVRSVIMTLMAGSITVVVFSQLGTINLLEDAIMGISAYLTCLFVTRLFDTRIVKIAENILLYLDHHVTLRDFMVKNF